MRHGADGVKVERPSAARTNDLEAGCDRRTMMEEGPEWHTGPMLAHVSIQCTDLARSAAFYDAVLAPLGEGRVMDLGDAIGYGIAPSPSFWIGRQQTGDGFRETHIAFQAPDRAAVGAFYEAALALGAESLHEPQLWPEYHTNYFAAFVRDPDGNNIEAVTHSRG